MKRSHAFALLLPLLATPLAAHQALAQGTEAQRAACTPDVFRLCASAVPNVGDIKACLARQQSRLSPACRTAMDEAGATRQAEAPPPRERVAERRAPAVRLAGPRRPVRVASACACGPRVAARAGRYAYRGAVPHRYRVAGRRARGYGSEMQQAMYWMRTLSSLSGSMGGSMGGFSLGSLAGLMP